MSDELDQQAVQVVDLIRAHRQDGSLVIDRKDAVAAVLQLVRASYTGGVVAGSRSTGDSMLRAFDAVTGAAR